MTDDLGIGVPIVQAGNLATELISEFVALRATKFDEVMKTKVGDNEATWCEALIIDNGDDYRNLGEMPLFWTVIRRQLRDNREAGNRWLIGRVTQAEAKGSRDGAYMLDAEISSQEYELAVRTIKRHNSDPIAVERPEEGGKDF